MLRLLPAMPAVGDRTQRLAARLLASFVLVTPRAHSLAGQERDDDPQNMMDQLGVKAIRRGPNPNDQSTFDEAKANPYKESMPDVLRMKDGTRVTRARQWPKR